MWLAQLGQAYALAGKVEKAREVLRQLEDPSRPLPTSPYHLAYVHTGLGDSERAMDCLERAFEEGAGAVFGMKGSFLLAPLRHHPRFKALLGRMRLA
jgi:tetratricopeptide (TPR) repeat protein